MAVVLAARDRDAPRILARRCRSVLTIWLRGRVDDDDLVGARRPWRRSACRRRWSTPSRCCRRRRCCSVIVPLRRVSTTAMSLLEAVHDERLLRRERRVVDAERLLIGHGSAPRTVRVVAVSIDTVLVAEVRHQVARWPRSRTGARRRRSTGRADDDLGQHSAVRGVVDAGRARSRCAPRRGCRRWSICASAKPPSSGDHVVRHRRSRRAGCARRSPASPDRRA